MQPFDLHLHTTFSDGKNTPEEMVRAAINLGLKQIGISDHSCTFFDTSYCIAKERLSEYKAKILSLKQKYADKISVLLGFEQDFYADPPGDGCDYLIGSVHYLFKDGVYLPVDESAAHTKNAVEKHFGGDPYAYAFEYFRTVASFCERDDVKYIGHFDILSKFNQKCKIFDTNNPRYVNAWQNAADKLIKAGKVFEINYRSMLCGLTDCPHPSEQIIKYCKEHGASFIKSSDSHSVDDLVNSHKNYF